MLIETDQTDLRVQVQRRQKLVLGELGRENRGLLLLEELFQFRPVSQRARYLRRMVVYVGRRNHGVVHRHYLYVSPCNPVRKQISREYQPVLRVLDLTLGHDYFFLPDGDAGLRLQDRKGGQHANLKAYSVFLEKVLCDLERAVSHSQVFVREYKLPIRLFHLEQYVPHPLLQLIDRRFFILDRHLDSRRVHSCAEIPEQRLGDRQRCLESLLAIGLEEVGDG